MHALHRRAASDLGASGSSRPRRGVWALAALAAVLAQAPAHAAPEPVEPARELGLLLGAATLYLGSELLKAELAPARCRWCDADEEGRSALNALDRAARDQLLATEPEAAHRASNLTAFLLVPLISLGIPALDRLASGQPRAAGEDALVVALTAALAADLNQATKLLAGRQRPYAHAATGRVADSPDANLSFYSGHTSLAFALATAGGTRASRAGLRTAPITWALGLGFAALSGYLRIAADRHYLTDVLTGALVGSLAGLLFVRLYAVDDAPSVQGAGPQLVAVGGRW